MDGVREPCAKLSQIGLDLLYHMEGLLRQTLEQILDESRVRLIDTISRTEKVWQPYNLQSKSNLRTLLREMEAMEIDMKPQVTGDTWINLTQSTVNFCRHYLSICESCAILAKMEAMRSHTQTLLQDLFLAQYNSKPNPNVTVDVSIEPSLSNYFFDLMNSFFCRSFMQLNFVSKNNAYLVDTLLPVAIAKYQKISGSKCEILTGLLNQLRGPPKPKPRSIYKTDVL